MTESGPSVHMTDMGNTSFTTEHSPGYPVSVTVARALAKSVRQDRAAKQTWKAISEKMSITRVEAMQLAYNLDDVVERIKAARAAA
ncbi:hypothetical protein [Arthrobacter sp. H14]|uniref:hypothetical protein n=1 Tax=Arthrobacter sp. H14 TaxID=1312959 RepID=UPI00047AC5F1|nr:hypothetical protein [Arthrobacter sp. H14]